MTLRSTLVRRAGAACTFLALLFSTRVSRGDSPQREAVVVEVTPRGSLDAYRLRAAIGVELGVDAVGADDPKAEQARGTFTVGVDQATHHLTVSYKARSDAIDRTVNLPGDPEAAQRAAVVLAGNLGRDEASELAAELRRTAPPQAPPSPSSPRTSFDDVTWAKPGDHEKDAAELQGVLDYYAAQDHRIRVTMGWSLLAVGGLAAGAIGVSPWISQGNSPALSVTGSAIGVAALAGLGMAAGAALVWQPSCLETVASYGRQGGGTEGTANEWIKCAAREHSSRKVGAVILMVDGAVAMAIGIGEALDASSHNDPGARVESTAITAVGAFYALFGIGLRASDGPVESALHAYELGHGIPLWQLATHVAVAPTAGGATAGFQTAF